MNTKIVKITEDNIDYSLLKEAGEIIKNGGLVAFPTETVYGLGGDALNPESSKKIYAAKGRPSDNPLIVHIYSLEDLDDIAKNVSDKAKQIMDAFWPGPLTLVFEKKDSVPKETTGGLDTVAVRFPIHSIASAFIEAAGGFIASPSANLSGRPSPTLAKYVIEDLDTRVDMIIDGGSIPIGLESTIVDMTSDVPTILRPGYVSKEMLEEVVGEVCVDPTILDVNCTDRPKAPGMRYRHYAPKADMCIVSGNEESVVAKINEISQNKDRCIVICVDEHADLYKGLNVKKIGSRERSDDIAANLYRILRECDDEGVEYIVSEAFSDCGLGAAIMNRLIKAAGRKIINV